MKSLTAQTAAPNSLPRCPPKSRRWHPGRDHKNLLKDISALSSVIIALGGDDALLQTARAIQEVGRQWP